MSSGVSLTSWGEGASLALDGHPFSDGITIKIPYGLDILLHLPLLRKDSIIHMHGLAVYVKEGLPFAQDLSLESSADSYLCF